MGPSGVFVAFTIACVDPIRKCRRHALSKKYAANENYFHSAEFLVRTDRGKSATVSAAVRRASAGHEGTPALASCVHYIDHVRG
jgi:hypothetical protein